MKLEDILQDAWLEFLFKIANDMKNKVTEKLSQARRN